ncbi:hypothetical protein ACFQ1S_11955 [Kibdelosporangium lantanae]|uniref:Uncharacterized protein n=1 Tax=Kibdelosporangium lantanae TaxID=1497396 RepID=A0ABW3M6K9_9PSEU
MSEDAVEQVGWSGRRDDIVEALDALATITPDSPPRWPDFTNAIHWLVDDTSWDRYQELGDERFNPAAYVGPLLRDDHEVDVITAVLDPLLAVLRDLGPVRPDAEYLARSSTHAGWTSSSRTSLATARPTAGPRAGAAGAASRRSSLVVPRSRGLLDKYMPLQYMPWHLSRRPIRRSCSPTSSAARRGCTTFADLVRCETRLYNALNDRLRERHGIVTSQYEFLHYLRQHPASRVAGGGGPEGAAHGASSTSTCRYSICHGI